ncbi:MAG: threonine/serine exporter family protein [Marinifilaceae bacterium]|nr:threonine/serine exporter family protein [Marinifilaceae bacterium]
MNWSIWEAVLLDGVFAAVAAIGFSVISNPPKQAIFISALLAAIGHGLRFYLLHYMDVPLIPATLVAAFTIGMFSIFFARLIHCPAEVFSFPSLLPMIPGMYAYKTILAFIRFMNSTEEEVLQRLIVEIFRNGLTTVFVLTVLVVGITLPLFIFHKQSITMTRFRKQGKA